jgi:four helix bundle protein
VKTSQQRAFDLEERLVSFAVMAIQISESLPDSKAGNHLSGQLVRSATSPALNYGEAQSAESKEDFIHKLKLILKELRETSVSLKIIRRITTVESAEALVAATDECNQLISIFVKSIQTVRGKLLRSRGAG